MQKNIFKVSRISELWTQSVYTFAPPSSSPLFFSHHKSQPSDVRKMKIHFFFAPQLVRVLADLKRCKFKQLKLKILRVSRHCSREESWSLWVEAKNLINGASFCEERQVIACSLLPLIVFEIATLSSLFVVLKTNLNILRYMHACLPLKLNYSTRCYYFSWWVVAEYFRNAKKASWLYAAENNFDWKIPKLINCRENVLRQIQ